MALSELKANEAVRDSFVQRLEDFLSHAEQVLRVKSNKIALPYVNANGNEIFVEFTVSIPRGSKDEPYDGFALAEDYKHALEEKTEKEKEKAKKKAKKIKADEERRQKEKEQE